MEARIAKTFLKPFFWSLVGLYFLVDAVSAYILRPLNRWIERISSSYGVTSWIRERGPYQSLMLFAVPLVLLEPVKPVSVYLVSAGKMHLAFWVFVVGEAIKILVLERIFKLTLPKLLTFPFIAFVYENAVAFFSYLASIHFIKFARDALSKLKTRIFAHYKHVRASYYFGLLAKHRGAPPG